MFCLRDHGPTRTQDGLQETTNQVFPSNAPSLVIGSAATDTLLDIPMDDNVVFYGFGGNDSVQWQVGGEFFGGDDNDTVIGLTAGFFNGESGQNTVEAATTDASISNANIVRANVPSPQAPTRLEVVGVDDYNVHVRWSENETVIIEVIDVENGQSFFNDYRTDKHLTNLGPRFGYELQIKGRTVLELDDTTSLLSGEAKNVSFSKPELNELITRFNGELIRGPERFYRFTDATTLPGALRWLTAASTVPYANSSSDEPLIQMRLADQSTIETISRNTLGQMLNAEFSTCGVVVGESTHIVVAVTENNVEAIGFDADTLLMRWRHEISSADNYGSVCRDIFYSDGSLYLENRSNSRIWTDTVRVSDSGDIKRIPAPQLANDGLDQQPIRMHRLSSANGNIAISFLRAQNTAPEFPFDDRTILVVHNFDDSGNASQVFTLEAEEQTNDSEYLSGTFRSVTDGSNAWLIAHYSEFEHAILRINLSTGKVDAIKRYELPDEIYSNFDARPNLISINANVIEIGRQARVIRIDANTLERLIDVKVAGTVVAFDENKVITRVSDELGVSAYSFTR